MPSLLDETGYFYSNDRQAELLARARLDELETEFRAQIEAVLAAGLRPTHLDWHCLRDGGRPDIFDLTLGLASEYGLALRVFDPTRSERLQRRGLPATDHGVVDSTRLATAGKTARFVRMLRELPAGLSEWAVHPGLGTAEARAIDGWWASARRTCGSWCRGRRGRRSRRKGSSCWTTARCRRSGTVTARVTQRRTCGARPSGRLGISRHALRRAA